jgi:hypothetical protein
MPLDVCEGEWRVRTDEWHMNDGTGPCAPTFRRHDELFRLYLTKSRGRPRWRVLRDIPRQTLDERRPYECHLKTEAIHAMLESRGATHTEQVGHFKRAYQLLATTQPPTPAALEALRRASERRRLERL